ncbi:bifunctional solanapyrone synthase [Achaetomium macrosporum]|uniref:Bifunctional solanapyrone synthase n=1 Tax=Achaetomium macrosporum TaxID=79813 RepID=A0AAN7C7S5_9PEZI|nr:bifunctional solanapyrone synthase [Achaetomium macrosporum]
MGADPKAVRPARSVALTSAAFAVAAIGVLAAAVWPGIGSHIFSIFSRSPKPNLGPEALASATCHQLRAKFGSVITLPTDTPYTSLTEENWSQSCWLPAACVAQPASAADVQHLVTMLVAANVPFAIRSGGHSPSPHDASIEAAGVLIALDKLDHITYDSAASLVTLGAGARWDAVYTLLDSHNVTMVGGRVMPVGVGGLTLGGGLSYLSDLYGLVCDNVASFEVVLADGSLVEASPTSHPDLFWALKGGSNNFGIVTSYRSPTYPIKDCWGGMLVFTPDQLSDVLLAYNEYQHTPDKDLHANLVLNIAVNNASVLLTLVYLQPVERPAAYAPFYKLTPVADMTGFYTLHEIMGMFPLPDIQRKMWYTNSFEPSPSMFEGLANIFQSAPEVTELAALTAGTMILTLQPIHPNVILQGQAKGGNALGLEPRTQTWFGLNYGWWFPDDDATALRLVPALHDRVDELAKREHVWLKYLFMNDAFHKQPVISSYGPENVARLKAVQKKYDPDRVFQRLVPGGQKLPP